MKNSRTLADHHEELAVKAVIVDILQAPVVVVVVVRTKIFGTAFNLVPRGAVERHSHVVSARYPRRNFHLEEFGSGINCTQQPRIA